MEAGQKPLEPKDKSAHRQTAPSARLHKVGVSFGAWRRALSVRHVRKVNACHQGFVPENGGLLACLTR